MYPALAYTRQMQLVLSIVTISEIMCSTVMIANILLKVTGLRAGLLRNKKSQ